MLKVRSLAMVLLIVLLLGSTVIASPQQIELLKVGLHSDENTLTPYTYVTGSPGLEMVNLIYDPLFNLDEDNIPQPWLVEEYDVSTDGLVYTFRLLEGVKWHDGQQFTAEDVKFTYEYVLEYPKSRFTKPVSRIQEIEILDELTIRMTLETPDPNFLIQPIADLPILPKHLWESVDNPNEADIRIGTGPYILEEYKSDQYYKFRANPDYFRGTPVAETLIFPIIKDNTALFTALKSGEVDAVTRQLSPELVKDFETIDKLELAKGPGYSTTLLQFNNEKYPLNIREFREALFLVIDKNDIINTVLLGQAVVGSPGFIHPSSPYYNPEVDKGADVNRSIEILDELGFVDVTGDGFREDENGNKLELTLLVYANNPTRLRTAEIMSDSFKEVGLNVSVRAMDIQTVDSLVWPDFDVTKGRDYDMTMWGWSSSMQLFPSRVVELFHSDLAEFGVVNIGAFESEDFDRVAEKLIETTDEVERILLINELQMILSNEYPVVPLYYEDIVNVYDKTTYDGWVFRKGTGIINKLSFIYEPGLVSETTQEPVLSDETGASDDEDSSSSAQWLVLAAAVVVVLIFLMKGKRGK